MKALVLAAATVLLAGSTGCTHCDCGGKEHPRNGDRNGMSSGTRMNPTGTDDGNTAYGTSSTGTSDRTHAAHGNGSGSGSGSGTTHRTTGGVGDANAETGTLGTDSSSTRKTTKVPAKPGITGTHGTNSAGTGTSSGRQVN